jgi:hypothetical protein
MNQPMIVKYKKGRHLSNQLVNRPSFNLLNRKDGVLKAEIIFNDSCKYIHKDPKEQADWNKLTGRSWGFSPFGKAYMMHQNSSRFGWRYNPKTDLFETTWYLYDKGKRSFGSENDILTFQSEDRVNVFICPFIELGKPKETEVLYTALNHRTNEGLSTTKLQTVPNYDGWLAIGYFGGNIPATRDFNYQLTYL